MCIFSTTSGWRKQQKDSSHQPTFASNRSSCQYTQFSKIPSYSLALNGFSKKQASCNVLTWIFLLTEGLLDFPTPLPSVHAKWVAINDMLISCSTAQGTSKTPTNNNNNIPTLHGQINVKEKLVGRLRKF